MLICGFRTDAGERLPYCAHYEEGNYPLDKSGILSDADQNLLTAFRSTGANVKLIVKILLAIDKPGGNDKLKNFVLAHKLLTEELHHCL